MTTHEPGADDSYWRRPDPAAPQPEGDPATGTGRPRDGQGRAVPDYPGPPVTMPPPPGWRPPVVVNPAAPGSLPPQDHAAVETEERNARTVTYGIGMIAAAVMVILTCLLCARLLF